MHKQEAGRSKQKVRSFLEKHHKEMLPGVETQSSNSISRMIQTLHCGAGSNREGLPGSFSEDENADLTTVFQETLPEEELQTSKIPGEKIGGGSK